MWKQNVSLSSRHGDTQVAPDSIKQKVPVLDFFVDGQLSTFLLDPLSRCVEYLDDSVKTWLEEKGYRDSLPRQGMDDPVPGGWIQTARPDRPHASDVDDYAARWRVRRDPVRVRCLRDRLGSWPFGEQCVRQDLE